MKIVQHSVVRVPILDQAIHIHWDAKADNYPERMAEIAKSLQAMVGDGYHVSTRCSGGGVVQIHLNTQYDHPGVPRGRLQVPMLVFSGSWVIIELYGVIVVSEEDFRKDFAIVHLHEDGPMVTKSGRVLTDADIELLAQEAAQAS